MTTKKKSVRLSAFVGPSKYELAIAPDLEAFTFEGDEVIHLTVLKDTKTITLHSKDIEIETAGISSSAKGSTGSRQTMFAAKISYDIENETATFTFPKIITKGKIKLRIVFRGLINEHTRGFYRSSYTHEGKTKFMGTTQFEATDARRAFPCFDEPAHKAIFEVKLIIPGTLSAISNTLETNISEHSDGFKIVEFAPTPKMSTYLLAFMIGDFEHIKGKTKEGIIVRVFTTPGKLHQAEFALKVGMRTISFFNEYFGIAYPLPILDMIAIPDFESGAMENWGAVTYREAALLVDTENSSLATRQRVAEVIAHELAHQWFGNLVTMEWWTHLWLNEGFATYIAHVAIDSLFPEWNIWNQFIAHDFNQALSLDALDSTHPIEVPVHHPNEINEIFDAVSYQKGASVIRMLAEYLGEEHFRNGLRNYLKKHSYKNTVTEDLWDSLEKVSKKPVRKIMSTWTGKPGYPLISVSRKNEKLVFFQERFFSSSISANTIKDKTIWPVPLSIHDCASDTGDTILFDTKNVTIESFDTPIKINVGETGLYRVRYDDVMLTNLHVYIENKKLNIPDRLGILRDVFALAEAGKQNTVSALSLIPLYKNEDAYTVWIEIVGGIRAGYFLLENDPLKEKYKEFARGAFEIIFKKVGFEKKVGESDDTTLLRSLVLGALGSYGDENILKKARALFTKVTTKNNGIPADLRGVAYSVVARFGGESEFKKLTELYKKETLSEEKNRLGNALAQFKDKKILEEVLQFGIGEHVRAQDFFRFFAMVCMNPQGKEIAWKFMQKNWKLILERYGIGGHALSHLVGYLAVFSTEQKANEIEKFFKTHQAPGAERSLRQALEKIRSNAAWIVRDKASVKKWLQKKK